MFIDRCHSTSLEDIMGREDSASTAPNSLQTPNASHNCSSWFWKCTHQICLLDISGHGWIDHDTPLYHTTITSWSWTQGFADNKKAFPKIFSYALWLNPRKSLLAARWSKDNANHTLSWSQCASYPSISNQNGYIVDHLHPTSPCYSLALYCAKSASEHLTQK